jgi:hypothetical protein
LYNGDVPDPDAVFAALADRFLEEPDVEVGRIFHSEGLKRGGKIFAMLVGGDLVLKLPAERCTELVAAGAERFEPRPGRVMREWVAVAEPDAARWRGLAEEALAFNRSSAP